MIFKLRKPFIKWDAYKLGIIDKRGNTIYDGKLTNKQKKAWTKYDIFIRNIKRLIEKLPGGNTRIGTYAAILTLLKENHSVLYNLTEECQQELYHYYYNIIQEEMGSGAITGGEPTITTQAIPDKIKIYNYKNKFIKHLRRKRKNK